MDLKRVLVVEDETIIAEDLKRGLGRMGYEVCGLVDAGEEAVLTASRLRPDLVLMDVYLRGVMDGIDAADQIWSSYRIPVVLLTAYADLELLDRAKSAQAFGYVLKPFEIYELRAAIEVALSKKAQEVQLIEHRRALEDRVRERTRELETLNRELRAGLRRRELAEEALRESEARYRAIFEQARDAIMLIQPENGRFVDFNRRAHESLGYDREEFKELTWFDLSPPENRKTLWGLDAFSENPGEHHQWTKSGQLRIVSVSAQPIRLGGRRLVLAICHDVTDRKMLEEQLMRSERLGATGRLAASVAHEINSPLQAVALLLGSLKRKAPRHPELLEDVDLLQASFELIKITVNQLLDLNRPGKNQRQPTDVNEVVEQTAGLLRSQVTRHKIEIDLRLDDGLPTVTASPTQLGQCLINLVNNAMEAILSQRNSEYPREAEAGAVGRIHIETGRAGDQVRIRLVDNGPGIPPDMLENVFDPFFTSKKKMGLGVGLSICHRIMEQHEGRIVAANAADSGAVFDLYLPGPPLAGDDWR